MRDPSSEEEELRKRALEKFFEEAEFRPRELYELIDKVSEFVTINKIGDVFVKQEMLTIKEKLGLAVCARFLGNHLNEEITPVVSADELVKYLMIQKNVAAARLADLVREGFLLRIDRGSFKARSLPVIKRFIERLIEKRKANV